MLAVRSSWYMARRGGKLAASSAALVGGVAGYSMTPTTTTPAADSGSNQQQQQQPFAIIIPTLQATGRALNLFQTAFMMAVDYQTANWTFFQFSPAVTSADVQQQQKVDYWEQQVQQKHQALQKAQATYASPSQNSSVDDNDSSSTTTNLSSKPEQKQLMLQAARELAHAQEQLDQACVDNGHMSTRTSQTHYRAAQRLLKLCHENKGVYIKVGQHIGNLDYLVPAEYIETLAALLDDNPQTDFQQVQAVICDDLGVSSPDDIFDRFDPIPIASASLAQVHVAYDKQTGRKLAVKVQHQGLRETAMGDLIALKAVVQWAEWLFDEFNYLWICEELEKLLPLELDFENEGRNAEKAAQHLATTNLDCVIPKILWQYTSPRVLTMEFEEGFKATNVDAMHEAGLCPADVAKLISSVFAFQIFVSRFVHSDPHAANVLIRAKQSPNGRSAVPEMVLVDHGLYRELDRDFARHYAALWKALMLADIPGIQNACAAMGLKKEYYPLFAGLLTARPFDEIVERSKTKSLPSRRRRHDPARGSSSESNNDSMSAARDDQADKIVIRGYAQRYLGEILRLLTKVPRQMLLLLKTADCLRHIDHALLATTATTTTVPINSLVVSGSYAAYAVYRDECEQLAATAKSTHHWSSWMARFQAWMRYMGVVLRIRIHQTVLQMSSSPGLSLLR